MAALVQRDACLPVSVGLLPVRVTLTSKRPRFVPEEHGMNSRLLAEIDKIAEEGIREGLTRPPGGAVPLKDGRDVARKAGTHVWNEAEARRFLPKKTDVYDHQPADTTATLLAVMKLYDGGRLNLQTGKWRF